MEGEAVRVTTLQTTPSEKLLGESEAARGGEDWVEEDELAALERFNAGGGDMLRPVRGPGTTTETPVDLDAHDAAAPPPTPEQQSWSLRRYLREKWDEEQLARNKEYGMDPYVRVKLGQHGTYSRTRCCLSTRNMTAEQYRNPKYHEVHNNTLTIYRSAGDRGEIILEVMDEGDEKDRFIGGCHVHLTEFLEHAQNSTDWKHTMFHLFDRQPGEDDEPDAEERDAGGIHALVRWKPELDDRRKWLVDENGKARGVLEIKVIAGADLRDISDMKISDITSFADTSAMDLTLYALAGFMAVFVYAYRFEVWPDAPRTDLFLDTTVFVVTSFTTAGYGDQPTIISPLQRAFTVGFIILGTGLLGVLIGAVTDVLKVKFDIKQKKRMQANLQALEDEGVDTRGMAGDDENDRLQGEAQRNLELRRKKGELKDGDDDEYAMQREIGRVLQQHFWRDELRKAVLGLLTVCFILGVGAGVFMILESDECFRTLQDELKDDACEGAFLPGHGPKLVGGKKGLSAVDALYFMTVTASTVGYGDVTPQSYLGKCFGCLYFPFAVAIMSRTIMSIALIPTEHRKLKLEAYVLDQFGDQLNAADLADLKASVNVKPGEPLHKNDFTLAMLQRLGRVSKFDIVRAEQVFSKLDKDHSGVLNKEDLQDLLAMQRRRFAVRAHVVFAFLQWPLCPPSLTLMPCCAGGETRPRALN